MPCSAEGFQPLDRRQNNVIRQCLSVVVALVVAFGCTTVSQAASSDADVITRINEFLKQYWKDNDVTPSERADDGEFARRASLDIVGHTPPFSRLVQFLGDSSPDKRRNLVDELLDDPAYAEHFSTIWGNILIGRANNRRTNRGELERWLKQQFDKNAPYDRFAFDLISAEGESARNGAVGFLAAHLNEQAVPATAITARIFLGMQVQCTQCHNHPFNDWKQSQFWGMNAFFRGTRRQGAGGNQREEFSLSDNNAESVVFFEKRSGLMEAITRQFVDGTLTDNTSPDTPRKQLAKLVIDPSKPYLTHAIVNRMWAHYVGTGFTKPIDDMGPHNPPCHPEMVEFLATEFRASGYDLKRLTRWITASDTYNLTSRTHSGNKIDEPASGATPLFSRMYVKPFTAEQLYDSLIVATDAHKSGRNYEQSERQRNEWLAQFVRAFGTDENDESTDFNGTVPQALVMMNGDLIRSAISGDQGSFLRRVLDGSILKTEEAVSTKPSRVAANRGKTVPVKVTKGIPGKIEILYLTALARKPSTAELAAIDKNFHNNNDRDPIHGLQDVFWALLNSNEFIFNH
jgi:hypothetical protein